MTYAGIESVAVSGLITLAEAALRALALAVVAGGILALLRVRHTSVKLCVWTVVLVAAVAMPALDLVLPALPLRIIPAWMATSGPVAPTLAGIESPRSASTLALGEVRGGARGTAPIEGAAAVPSNLAASAVAAPTTQAGLPTRLSSSWMVLLFVVYMVGALALFARAAIGWFAAFRLQRTAASIDDEAAPAISDARAAGAAPVRSPCLCESAACLVPMTIGIVRPVIVLPSDWRAWSETTLNAVLIHELAHIARRDALAQRLSLLHRAVFWFSPLGWWLHRQLCQLAEYASDEAVLAGGVNQTTYAEALLGFFTALGRDHRGEWAASSASNEHLAMAQRSGPGRRVQRIFAWRNGQSHRLTMPIAVAIALVAAPMVAVTAAIQPERAVVAVPAPRPLEPPPVSAGPLTERTVNPPTGQQGVASAVVAEKEDALTVHPLVDYSGRWRLVPDAALTGTGEFGDEFTATQDATRLVIEIAGFRDVYQLDGSESRNRGILRPNGIRSQEMVARAILEGAELVITSTRPTTADFEGMSFHAIQRARVVLSLKSDGSLVVEETTSITTAQLRIPQRAATTRRVYRRIS